MTPPPAPEPTMHTSASSSVSPSMGSGTIVFSASCGGAESAPGKPNTGQLGFCPVVGSTPA